jgi:hypothetical protein
MPAHSFAHPALRSTILGGKGALMVPSNDLQALVQLHALQRCLLLKMARAVLLVVAAAACKHQSHSAVLCPCRQSHMGQ